MSMGVISRVSTKDSIANLYGKHEMKGICMKSSRTVKQAKGGKGWWGE